MTVKVLVTQLGQQIIADAKQIENKETNDIVGYWLSQPRLVQYSQNEEGELGVNFASYCVVSDEAEFSLRADHVVAILEPRDDVAKAYQAIAFPEPPAETENDTVDDVVTDEAPVDEVEPVTADEPETVEV